jgi:hypothetical protein
MCCVYVYVCCVCYLLGVLRLLLALLLLLAPRLWHPGECSHPLSNSICPLTSAGDGGTVAGSPRRAPPAAPADRHSRTHLPRDAPSARKEDGSGKPAPRLARRNGREAISKIVRLRNQCIGLSDCGLWIAAAAQSWERALLHQRCAPLLRAPAALAPAPPHPPSPEPAQAVPEGGAARERPHAYREAAQTHAVPGRAVPGGAGPQPPSEGSPAVQQWLPLVGERCPDGVSVVCLDDGRALFQVSLLRLDPWRGLLRPRPIVQSLNASQASRSSRSWLVWPAAHGRRM